MKNTLLWGSFPCGYSEFIDFIGSQTILKELVWIYPEEYEGPHKLTFFSHIELPLLEKRTISFVGYDSIDFSSFFRSSKSTLKSLKVIGEFEFDTYEVILNELTNLKELLIAAPKLPNGCDFFSKFKDDWNPERNDFLEWRNRVSISE